MRKLFVLPDLPEVNLVTRFTTVASEPFWFYPVIKAGSGLPLQGMGGIWKADRQIGQAEISPGGAVRCCRLPGRTQEWRQFTEAVGRWFEKPSNREAVNAIRGDGMLRFVAGSSVERQAAAWVLQSGVDCQRDLELAEESRRRTVFHLKDDPPGLVESVPGAFSREVVESVFIKHGHKLDWVYVRPDVAFEKCTFK